MRAEKDLYELSEKERERVCISPYCNNDLLPTPIAGRKWGVWDIASLWIGMCVCIPTYMLASSLISGGMNWWQAILTIFLGNVIVLIPMLLNAHAGTKYGIPAPVFARLSFGVKGASIPALIRAVVACGWFGIQTWIGGWAIYKLLTIYFTGWDTLAPVSAFLGINLPQLLCFLFFWLINMFVIYKGMELIKYVENYASLLLLFVGFALFGWAYFRVGSFGPMFRQESHFSWKFFFPALTGMVGFWATLSLNIPDFTRYARSQKVQVLGQVIGLNITMPLYSFIGVAVTSATIIIYGQAIWDPVVLLSQFKNPLINALAQMSLFFATLTTNLAANIVAPANAFSNLAPKKISFRTGGLITGLIGILMMPWKLVNDPKGYIFTWLIGYSALLGPIAGIMIADYVLIRKRLINLAGLYTENGEYKNFNWKAVIALIAGVIPNIPGFLGTVGLAGVGEFWMNLYNYAWFIGFGLAFLLYAALMAGEKGTRFPAAD